MSQDATRFPSQVPDLDRATAAAPTSGPIVETLPSRVSAAVTTEIADAVRRSADARGLSSADYVRGAVQARLLLDGARVAFLPNLMRLGAKGR